MTLLVTIKTDLGDFHDSEAKAYVAESVGQALDKHAPDPRHGASFTVTVTEQNVTVCD